MFLVALPLCPGVALASGAPILSGLLAGLVGGTGRRFGYNMISAITNKGALAFMVFQDKFKAPVWVAFLQRLLTQMAGKIHLIVLIVDGHQVHQPGKATRFAATHSARLRLIRMPGYRPERNSR